ncbi:MAG: hypothetical protein JXA37_01280 [Chloroflexia bacterium]|nr:hypothetical protein [Chloroflexia bacterium]
MTEESLLQEKAGARLKEVQAELQRLRQEERQIKEEVAQLQAELSRSRGRDRRRLQLSRSASLPALKVQQQRLSAEIFRLEQEDLSLREQLGEPY